MPGWTRNFTRGAAFCAIFLGWTSIGANAQQFMNTNELLATLPESQISGIAQSDGKTPWVQAYSAARSNNTGLLNGLWNGKDKYTAEWSIQNDQWCETWDQGERCWSVERVGPKELRFWKDGVPQKNTVKIR